MPRILAKLTLEGISPISLGGYDTQMSRRISGIQIEEPFRLSSLKGVWKWWMRAYVAGAAFDSGFDEEDQKTKTKEIVNNLLGSTKSASLIGIKALKITYNLYKIKKWKEIPRLAQMRIKGIERCFASDLHAEIEIYKRTALTYQEERLLFGSLLTALKLGGLGKISRRGFGSLKVTIEKSSETIKDLTEIIKCIEQETDLNKLEPYIKVLMKETRNAADELLKTIKAKPKSVIPSIPSISLENKLAFSLYLIKPLMRMSVEDLLLIIGQSTLRAGGRIRGSQLYAKKASITAKLTGVEKNPLNMHVDKPLALFLGLPRKGKTEIKRLGIKEETGYLTNKRRASPLIFSLLNNNGIISLALIFSSDWPEEQIKWKGVSWKKKDRNIIGIKDRKYKSVKLDKDTLRVSFNDEEMKLLDIIQQIRSSLLNYFKDGNLRLKGRDLRMKIKEVNFYDITG